MKPMFRGQLSIAPYGSSFMVELRVVHPDGSLETLNCGMYANEADATARALEVQDKMLSLGGTPTAGTA